MLYFLILYLFLYITSTYILRYFVNELTFLTNFAAAVVDYNGAESATKQVCFGSHCLIVGTRRYPFCPRAVFQSRYTDLKQDDSTNEINK